MCPVFTTGPEYESQRCLEPSFGDHDTVDEEPSDRAKRSRTRISSSSILSPSHADNRELGEIPMEFLSADRGDSNVPDTANHGVPHGAQWMPARFPSFADLLPPDFTQTHPFLLILVRTLQAALCTFGLLAWLKIIKPSLSMSKGCIVAGIVVGVVFLKHLTTYLLPEFTYARFETSFLNWLRLRPRWSHFFSYGRGPFDLGGTLYADEVERDFGCKFWQEVLADVLGETEFRRPFEILTYPLSSFRELYSLPVIFVRTLRASSWAFLVNAFVVFLAPEQSLDFYFTGVVAGGTFLKQILAYLRPKIPDLWVMLALATDGAMICLPLLHAQPEIPLKK